jgi:hypothetical protein
MCCRLSPSCEELASATGSLPGLIASMLCSLPLLCSEACVRQWKQQAGPAAAAVAGSTAAATANTSYTCKPALAGKRKQSAAAGKCKTQDTVAAGAGEAAEEPSKAAGGCAASGGMSRSRQAGGQGSHTLKARNARLEVLLATTGALELQVGVVASKLRPNRLECKQCHIPDVCCWCCL